MASETPASDHPAPPSQEEAVKELQSDVKGKIESEAVCSPGPAPVSSNPEIEAAKGEEKPKAEALATEVEAIPVSDQVVKKIDEVEAALLSEDKPVVDPPAEELVKNKDKPVGSPEAGEEEAEVVCVTVEDAAAEKPEDKQVEVQQGIGVAPELSDPPAEKVEECKIVLEQELGEVEKKTEDAPVEVEKKAEDALIAEKVPAPDESTGSEPAEVEKKIESDSSIPGEKSGPEPDEKEKVEESKEEPVIQVSPKKAGPEKEEELKVEPVGTESQEQSGPESAEKEELQVKPVNLVCEAPDEEKSQELPAKVMEPIEAGEDAAAVSAAACKPEVASVEQVEVPEAEDIKLFKEKDISATEILDQVKTEKSGGEAANKDTDKLVEKAGEQGNLPGELAEEPIEVKGSLEVKGVVGEEDLVPCEEKATEDVINFTPSDHGKEPRELAAETIQVKGSSDNKPVEPEKVEEEKSVVAEELFPCAEVVAEAAIDSAPPSQPTEAIVISRDTELEAEKGKNKEATAAMGETEKDVESCEGKEDKTEAEDKAEQPVVPPIEAKIEEEKRVDVPAKRDIQQSECNKDSEAHKGDVKPQKQSIVKMVKQSLVKAKKAIIGKSHNSKTTASEPKDNAND